MEDVFDSGRRDYVQAEVALEDEEGSTDEDSSCSNKEEEENVRDNDMIFVALYVDDLVIASNNNELLKSTKKALGDRFDMTDLGNLRNFFFGMEVDQDFTVGTISIRQSKFAKDILEKFGMEHSNPVKTPKEPGLNMTRSMCEGRCKHEDPMASIPYRNAVGCLMYLMEGTRPDLAAAVGVLSQFVAGPCPTRWQALKRVFRYVQGTQTHGIEFKPQAMTSFKATQMQTGLVTWKLDEAQVDTRSC
uniref:Reverse transcriptase Ty1/copia-type domain-containing protein n=1 Tax=Peronospora matthiolae TaxID=2874970 RepID=A0AAV1TJU3_9STRA